MRYSIYFELPYRQTTYKSVVLVYEKTKDLLKIPIIDDIYWKLN